MIELSGLRRYITPNNRARLEADIKFFDIDAICPADTIYIEIDANYGGMLVNDTCDPFALVALYLAMHHKTDLRIRGNVSKRLYKNLTWYAQKILCDYSSDLVPVKIIVDGFAPTKITGTLIGAGISCGVDSLTTLYDRFIAENDPDYKINALFFFNCGANGNYTNSFTQSMTRSRLQRAESLAAVLCRDESSSVQVHRADGNVYFFRDLWLHTCSSKCRQALLRRGKLQLSRSQSRRRSICLPRPCKILRDVLHSADSNGAHGVDC